MNDVIASAGGLFSAGAAPEPLFGNPYQRDFLLAVRAGDKAQLERILRVPGRVNINLHGTDGQTALHESCHAGNIDLVKVLVESGADVKLANRDGWNALHIAAYSGHHDIVIYLIAASRRAKPQS